MTLEKLRNEIDKINSQILKLLKQREEIGIYLAMNKRKMGLPLKDDEREKNMLAGLKAKAKDMGLSESYIENLFQVIIEETLRVEEEQ